MKRLLAGSSLAWWALVPLLLQCLALNGSAALTWPTWALVGCVLFKLRECRRPFDRRLVVLLQVLSAGLLAAQLQGLLATVLQAVSVLLALGGLLAHELGGLVSLRGLLGRSLQLLLAALPLALVLFLFVPRIPPLWTVDLGPSRGAVTGLSPDLDPLGIVALAQVNGSAARVMVAEGDLPREGYWRVLVHDQFDGRRWKHREPTTSLRPAPSLVSDVAPHQWWSVEPSAIRAVPWDGVALPTAADQWITPEGELLVGGSSRQRRSYRLQAGGGQQTWQQRSPLPKDLQLPRRGLSRLRRLAAPWRELPTSDARLRAAETWFRSQPFRYSLQPGGINDLDAFLFDRQVGFCGHYAGALAALMRAADVPSRVVSGYQGGRRVDPLSGSAYLDLRQSDAHAWVEVWLDGAGWQRVDPTTWINSDSGGTRSEVTTAAGSVVAGTGSQSVRWWQWLQWQWWGLDLAWTRWWLSFDQSSQQAWLRSLFGEQQRWWGLMALAIAVPAVWLGWWLLRGAWPLRFAALLPFSPWLEQPLQRSLRSLARLGVEPEQGETFPQLCRRAAAMHPDRAERLLAMADHQQLLLHASLAPHQRRSHLRQWRLLRRSLEG
jgi:transglutaminase-like putative cysteine protease